MSKGTGAGGDAGKQDGGTDDTKNNQGNDGQDLEDQDLDLEGKDDDQDGADDQDEKLPKSKAELNKLMQDRLNRQKKQLDKKHKAELTAAQNSKDKSELELEKEKASKLTGKITEKNFIIAAKDAGASQTGAEKLFRLMKDDIDADDDGEINNIEDLIESGKKDFEELFGKKKRGSGDGGAGGGSGDDLKDPVKAFNQSIKAGLGYE
jgi:hypothetical protein